MYNARCTMNNGYVVQPAGDQSASLLFREIGSG
ncbi:hypothetical protein FAES_3491 [Fibrella aestuarina BUZ 2]|uniref:Uncharacterized protein n=1 Tax=Fibrella aestuarina BUZ 2 TaxID=1166018 RepID=I0KBJ5_9BACT|nr:hypothetical protein FAES_3491 [Fibrella aestuarina BUZ 2]